MSELLDKMYYSIGEVSQITGLSTSLIRYWESEFPHLRPKTNKKGDRRYKAADIENIKIVQRLVKEEGYTLTGAKEYITKQKKTGNQQVGEKLEEIKSFLIALKSLLKETEGPELGR